MRKYRTHVVYENWTKWSIKSFRSVELVSVMSDKTVHSSLGVFMISAIRQGVIFMAPEAATIILSQTFPTF